jgi:glutamate dehydrogenase/leucine dehydrogenase
MRAIEGGIATHDDEAGEVVGGCRSRDRAQSTSEMRALTQAMIIVEYHRATGSRWMAQF